MTIILFLNLPLNLILQKTTKPNLPQSFPNIPLQHSLTTFPYTLLQCVPCVSPYSHTIFSQSTNFPYNLYTHTYTPCVHTLDFKIHTLPYTYYSHTYLYIQNTHTPLTYLSSHTLTHSTPILSYTTHTTHHIYTTHSSHTPTPFHLKYTHYSQPIHTLTYTFLRTLTHYIFTIQSLTTHLNHPFFLLYISTHDFNLNPSFQTKIISTLHFKPKQSQPSISFFPPKQRNIPLEYSISNPTMVTLTYYT
jgi:hypothetical protein